MVESLPNIILNWILSSFLFQSFDSTEEYYSVAFHELIHWTSHESRLDWMIWVDPSKSYMAFRFQRAYGEVVAHIGEGLLCIHFGLNPDTSPDRPKHLFENFTTTYQSPRVIVAALKRAKKAVRYLQKLQTANKID